MTAFISSLQGFFIIGAVILTGYIAARFRVGGPNAQMVLNRYSFFVANPCLMFTILSREKFGTLFDRTIIVAFFSAMAVGALFLIINALFFHLDAANATVGALNSLYLNSNNIGLPVATYILGRPTLVAPILVMQQALFTPIALTVLDGTTGAKISAKRIATEPLRQPLLIGSLGGIAVSAISGAVGHYIIPNILFQPLHMIGQCAVPMILMAFGMSLHGSQPLSDRRTNKAAVFTVCVLKNIVMPIVAFLLAYAMGFRGRVLYGCVVLAALPAGQNVYNYAVQYDTGTAFARDGVLISTMTAPASIALVALLLG